jgi:hypothetical protein
MQNSVKILALSLCTAAHAASNSLTPSEDALAYIQAVSRNMASQKESNNLAVQTTVPPVSFNPHIAAFFDTQMATGRSKIVQRRLDVSQTDIGLIYQEFSQYGVNALADAYPNLFIFANQLEDGLVKHIPEVQKKYYTALHLVAATSLEYRVAAWVKFNSAFKRVLKIYLQAQIPGLQVKKSAYKTMVENRNLQLLPEQVDIFKVGLFVIACNINRRVEGDHEAYNVLSKKFKIPEHSSAPAPEPSGFDSILNWAGSFFK